MIAVRPSRRLGTLRLLFLIACLVMLTAAAVTTCARPVYVRLEAAPQWREAFLQVVATQMGLRERTGRNDGPHIDAYLRAAGLGPGYAYCYAMPYWAGQQAAMKTNTTNPLPRTASTQTAFDRALQAGARVSGYDVGSIAIFRVPKRWEGHAMTIVEILGNGWVRTHESNTAAPTRRKTTTAAERDGQGNYERVRCLNSPLGRMYLRGIIVV